MQEPADFAEILAPLEARAGRRLNGGGRELCAQACAENDVGFRACVGEALRRGRENPLGLLVKMIQDGDWRVTAPEPPPPPCPSCSLGGGRHLFDCELGPGSRNREAAA